MFKGRTLLIVTKHKKEQVLAPLFEEALGVKCIVASFDTDALGTFTGEVEREGDAFSTIRRKCYEALALYNCDLAIASEGSFGAHPSIFIASADDELVMFVDAANDLEITARELTLDTNFNGAEIKDNEQLEDFLKQVKFPSHAVIIRIAEDENEGIVKGITDPEEVYRLSTDYFKKYGSFYIETDMRAMYNPTRMKVIEKAAQKLVEKINSPCPECKTPGYGITDAKAGLPCQICKCATASTLSYIYSCAGCSHKDEVLYPNGKEYEDPMYCNMCNP